MKAVAYMRCSGWSQVKDTDTWVRQREVIDSVCRAQGYELIAEYREEGVSGKLDQEERPAFQVMIADLLDNGCRTIIVESLDRLAREYRVQESLIIYIASKGLTLISANTGENITEAMMGDPMRRALVQIQGILAELDKNMIVAKLRKARQRIRATGKKCEGRSAYGVRAGESEWLAWILAQAEAGTAPSAIARMLNENSVPARYGRRWWPATVSKILQRCV